MDRSRFKRPETKIQRQTPKTAFGSTRPVPKVDVTRPRNYVDLTRVRPIPQKPTPPAPTTIVAKVAPKNEAPISVQVPKMALPPLEKVTESPKAGKLPIDMELPGEQSPMHFEFHAKKIKWWNLRRLASRGLAVSLVLMITLGGLLFSQSYLKLHKVFRGSTGTAAALQADVKPELLRGEGRGRVNILLLGRGGGKHDAPDLTDTIMIASVDPVNHTTALLSVPRDMWVHVGDHGVMKLNAAWETGVWDYLGKKTIGSTDPKAVRAGFDLVDQTVSDILGVSIDYNVLVDFQAFQQAVDTVGGVDINVPTDLVDPTMAWENNNNPTLATAGQQTFDGKHALIYARSRETTSDYARAERQRALLVALKAKVKTVGTLSNPLKISGLMSALGDNVQSDLSLSNANRLYSILKNVKDSDVSSVGLTDTSDGKGPYVVGGNSAGQSIVLPKAGLFKYSDIQQFVRSKLKDPYILKENARILVLNGSTLPGLANTKADELRSYGYNVVRVGNTPASGWIKTTLIDVTHDNKYTKNYLEQRFNQKAANSLNDTSIATNDADFVIILGSDEANPTQP